MRHFAILLFAMLILTSCSKAPATTSNQVPSASPIQAASPEKQKAPDSIVQFLLSSAATDFHEHGPAGPLQFRDIRVGHITGSDGKESYRLCGEFQQAGKTEWMAFTTIKTSGYEQYIGGQVAGYCPPSIVWDTDGDLSPVLQKQLDSRTTTEVNSQRH